MSACQVLFLFVCLFFGEFSNSSKTSEQNIVTSGLPSKVCCYLEKTLGSFLKLSPIGLNCPPLNMHLSSNTFQYFSHSLTKLSEFCVIRPAN
jgi:hypothetical protein